MIDLKTAPYAAAVLRVALGLMYLSHGLLKLVVFTPAGTAGFFASVGAPPELAAPIIAAEIIGGILLVGGLYGRWVALALVPVLIGSIALVHGAAGWQFGAEGGGWEYPAFLIAASLAVAGLGDGAFSLSRRFRLPILAPFGASRAARA